MSQSQIAFLFLTRGELNNVELWENYFRLADSSKYKLFIHTKEPSSLSSNLWKSPNSTILRPIPTTWGTVSLVKATLYLLNVAHSDTSIKKFILLSESCIPTTNFDDFYNSIIHNNQSYIHWVYGVNIDRLKIVNRSLNMTVSNHLWAKQSQWMLLDRIHTNELFTNLNSNSKCVQYLNGYTYCPAADEHFFINYFLYIAKCDMKNIINKPITFVDWCTGTQHPKTYNTLDEGFISSCRKQGGFFARKFNKLEFSNTLIELVLKPIENGSISSEEKIHDINTDISYTKQEEEVLKLLNKETITSISENKLNQILSILKDTNVQALVAETQALAEKEKEEKIVLNIIINEFKESNNDK